MALTPAERQRRYLARQREDLIVVNTVVVQTRTVEVLFALGFLGTDQPSREQLAAAFSKWAYAEMTRHEQALWPPL